MVDDADVPPAVDHYFTPRPRSPSERRTLRFLYRGRLLTFEVDRGVFASHGLDPGTALLIEALPLDGFTSLLDLGCGWGAVGVAAGTLAPEARITMTDVNRRAVQLAKSNARRNRLTNTTTHAGSGFAPVATESFDVIALNPAYHVGRPFVLGLLEESVGHLRPGGRLLVVGKGSQGIRFYQGWLEERWPGGVEVAERRSGYRVLVVRPDAASRSK